mgnify:CR=1 FL=1
MFPETPQTLLKKIADLAQGDDAAVWLEFVEFYTPPLRNFIRSINQSLAAADVEDAVQEVFIRLTEVLRTNGIDRTKGRFRDYLAAMTRRLLVDRYRAEQSRLAALDRAANPVRNRETLADGDPGALVDAAWQVAVRKAAIEHVLTQTAASEQSKRVYRAVVLEQCPMKEVAAEFGITYAAAKQIKSRLDRAVEAILDRF